MVRENVMRICQAAIISESRIKSTLHHIWEYFKCGGSNDIILETSKICIGRLLVLKVVTSDDNLSLYLRPVFLLPANNPIYLLLT